MPKTRPRPRLGLQGESQAATAYTTTIRAPIAPAIIRLRGCLGRSAPARVMAAASSEGGGHAVEILEGDPDRRAVGTHLHAGGALRPREAEVALRRHLHRLAVRTLLLLL